MKGSAIFTAASCCKNYERYKYLLVALYVVTYTSTFLSYVKIDVATLNLSYVSKHEDH
jgi:hypothetical protein